jgi:carbon monoxide dehydrogenase subunit G
VCHDGRVPTFEPVDHTFFDTAPVIVRTSVLVAAPRDRVFAAIASDPAGWGRWFPGFDGSGHWAIAGTPGVGSVRVIRAFRIRMEECVIAWDVDERFAFRVNTAGAAGALMGKAFAEDYRLSDDGEGTHLDWTVALRPALGLKPPVRLLRPLVQRILNIASGRLAKVA